MENHLHTVLGANGAIGRAVLDALQAKSLPLRAVTHTKPLVGFPTKSADLLYPSATEQAIEGSSHVYLCIGLPYQSSIWKKDWELIMKNVINACALHNAKLIFLDNIYMYAPPLPIPFDEQTRQAPISEKGKARKRTADRMMQAVKSGKIEGLIGRSADFYGKRAINSSLYISFLDNMLAGKKPLFLTRTDKPHTYAYVDDIGRALVELATSNDCYGAVWHLPVGKPITTNALLDYYNKALNTYFTLGTMPSFLRKLLSLFISPIKEVSEMLYQFEQDYVMSWDKFRQRFPDFKVTSYEEGVKETVVWFQENED